MRPTVLLYAMEPERARQIKLLCLPLKIFAREVEPEEYALPLQALLAGQAAPESAGEELGGEMLVMAGLSSAQMNRFLQAFRRRKLPPAALKAVATPTNLQWNAYELQRELERERQAFARGETAAHEGGEA